MNILFITTDWNTPYRIATNEYGGVGYYRAHAPAKALRAKGHNVKVLGADFSKLIDKDDIFGSYKNVFKDYDLVVVKQADTANAGKLIGACKELRIPIAMDLDDLITDVDPDNPAIEKGYQKGGAKMALACSALSMCDALFTTTEPLAKEYKKFLKDTFKVNMKTFVLPNCCDQSLWSKQKKEYKQKTVIGWHGSITHDNDLKIVFPAVKNLMEKYPNLFFSLTGGVRQETYDKVIAQEFNQSQLDRIMVLEGTQSYKDFPKYMARHEWDIAIAPLRDTKFSRGKSHIKWLEYSLLGVPTIASDVYPYKESILGTEVINHNKTGILVKDNEWEDALESLIREPKKGRYIARDARKFVLENWQYKNHIDKWEEAFASVIKAGSKDLK